MSQAEGRGGWGRCAGRLRLYAAITIAAWAAAMAQAERLVLATYNVENYVAADRIVDGVYRQDYPKPELAKACLREVIRHVNADILILQEMGNLGYLKELQRDLSSEELHYSEAEVVKARDSERHIAVLARRRLTIIQHTDLEFDYFGKLEAVKRGLLELRLRIGGREVAVFGAHLKSRLTDRSDDPESGIRRLAEARAIRRLIVERCLDPKTDLYLLLGDLNDTPRSKPLTALLRSGDTRLFDLLPATDSRGEVWTHFFRRDQSYSRVDYALASPAIREFVVDGCARIMDIENVTRASDHRPVVVVLEF